MEEKSVEYRQFATVCRAQTQGWKFAITRRGRMCLVPPGTEVGNELLLFESANFPCLTRPIMNGIRRRKDENHDEVLSHRTLFCARNDEKWTPRL